MVNSPFVMRDAPPCGDMGSSVKQQILEGLLLCSKSFRTLNLFKYRDHGWQLTLPSQRHQNKSSKPLTRRGNKWRSSRVAWPNVNRHSSNRDLSQLSDPSSSLSSTQLLVLIPLSQIFLPSDLRSCLSLERRTYLMEERKKPRLLLNSIKRSGK
ncbi:hypothetical protein VTK56DRAFT_10081 [Thermocarpiscus australiensis]